MGLQEGFLAKSLGYTQVTLQIFCVSPIKVLKQNRHVTFASPLLQRASESVGGTQGGHVSAQTQGAAGGWGAATPSSPPSRVLSHFG